MRDVLLAMTILLTCTVSGRAQSPDEQFDWLIGTWKLKDKPVFETWTYDRSTNALMGNSFKVNSHDTTRLEQVVIRFDNGNYHYIPDVAGNQAAVDFVMTKVEKQNFVAENTTHDFPKLIRYALVKENGKDAIEAAIEGDGKVIPYHFQRIK